MEPNCQDGDALEPCKEREPTTPPTPETAKPMIAAVTNPSTRRRLSSLNRDTEVSFNQIRDEHGFECIARGENDRTRDVAIAKEIGRDGCSHDPDNDRQPCFGP